MEVLLVIMGIIFSLCFLFEKGSEFIKQLKSCSAKLNNGFEARLSLVPIDNKKSEECATNTNSTNENLE